MKRNSDRDKIFFENQIDVKKVEENGEEKTFINSTMGPYCKHYESPRVTVGTEFCRKCPMCYGMKIRTWDAENTGARSYNGYIKCAADNQTVLNMIKCFWWKITGRKIKYKHF